MAQRKGLGTTSHVCNWAIETRAAKDLFLVVSWPGAKQWKPHSLLLGPHSYLEAVSDFEAQLSGAATRQRMQKTWF